jgi:hypothetical protein
MIFFFRFGVLDEGGRVEATLIVGLVDLGSEIVVAFLFGGPLEPEILFLLFVI